MLAVSLVEGKGIINIKIHFCISDVGKSTIHKIPGVSPAQYIVSSALHTRKIHENQNIVIAGDFTCDAQIKVFPVGTVFQFLYIIRITETIAVAVESTRYLITGVAHIPVDSSRIAVSLHCAEDIKAPGTVAIIRETGKA